MKKEKYLQLIKGALAEDVGSGDVTAKVSVPVSARFSGRLVARQVGVLSGMEAARAVFRLVSPKIRVRILVKDGSRFKKGTVLATVEGPARAVLTAERTALNFLQRMTGIATLTAEYADAVKGTGAKIYDTRKTTPGLRLLEKEAVRHGGGENHRFGLFDQVLIKDNHISAARGIGSDAAAIEKLVKNARKKAKGLAVEVEVENLAAAKAALRAGADIIMPDNFTPTAFDSAVKKIHFEAERMGISMPELEASGGITLRNVRKYALAGADRIAVGALTHSAPAADIGLDG